MNDPVTIANRRWLAATKAAKKKRGWSNGELARQSGVDGSTIGRVLRGVSTATERTRAALSKALGVKQ